MHYPLHFPPNHLSRVTHNFSSIPPGSSTEAMVPRSPTAQIPTRRNSRGSHFITNSPHLPTQTSSLPIQSISPRETVLHTCKWRKDDETICGAPITRLTVSEHLTTHGVERMARDHRLSCRWLGCHLRRGRTTINRESIARHVREKHLGCRRNSD